MQVLHGEVDNDGRLPRDNQDMKANKGVEHPPRRGVLDAFAFLVRKSRPVVRQHGADAGLQGRRDEQTDRHDHQQGHAPLGLCESERGGQQLRGFQEAKAAFGMRRPLLALEAFLGRSLGVVECIGGEEKATLLVDKRLPGSEARGQRPFEMVDHRPRGRPLARAPPPAIVGRGAYGALLHVRRRQAVRQGCQRRRRLGGPGPGGAAEVLEGLGCLGPLLQALLVDRVLAFR